ncbi:MAG: DUF6629 family protein [Patescibacteria group bacterium]
MCFCAPVSFVASAALGAAGVGSLRKASRRERMLASIPVLFAIQQFIEGLQWLAPKPSLVSTALGYGFLLFAYLIWPTYIPVAIYRAEHDPKRRRYLRGLIGLGLVTSSYLFVVLLLIPLTISVHTHSIYYQVDAFHLNAPTAWMGVFVYIFVISASFLASSSRFLRWFGVAALVSAFVAWQLNESTFTSVWCFFAAALSGLIYFHFKRPAKNV